MIRLACPHCGRNLRVKDELAGKRGVCPHCKERLTVPAWTPTLPFSRTERATAAHHRNRDAPERCRRAAPVDHTGEALDFLAPPQGPDELGRLGTYRILRVLGTGGMGMVLHAEDPVLKRAVALKVMRPALAKSKDARQRFLREARAIAALEHRHIVHIYQVAEDRGVPYLAMPFLKGESLEPGSSANANCLSRKRFVGPADRRGLGGRPQERADPPRHQARQHLAGNAGRSARATG